MDKDELKLNYDQIFKDFNDFENLTKEKLRNLILSAMKGLGEYFIPKGYKFVCIEKETQHDYIYFDIKTKVGIKFEYYLNNHVLNIYENGYQTITLNIVFKAQHNFLDFNQALLYRYNDETPEKVYNRFKKHNGKAGITRIKNYLKQIYPKEMLMAERENKIKNIQSV